MLSSVVPRLRQDDNRGFKLNLFTGEIGRCGDKGVGLNTGALDGGSPMSHVQFKK